MKNLALIISLFGLLLSCKKDKLKDDKAIFIGKWAWVYTYHNYGWCDGADLEEILTPITEETSFKMEFIKKGEFYFYVDNNKVLSFKMKFKILNKDSPLCAGNNWSQFAIDLNNKEEFNFGGCISSDTLVTTGFRGFEFTPDVNGCENYLSYFIRE
jgi:hypothetical protein